MDSASESESSESEEAESESAESEPAAAAALASAALQQLHQLQLHQPVRAIASAIGTSQAEAAVIASALAQLRGFVVPAVPACPPFA